MTGEWKNKNKTTTRDIFRKPARAAFSQLGRGGFLSLIFSRSQAHARGGFKLHLLLAHRAVAVQVEFERHILKPGLVFKGKGLKAGAFQLWVRGSQRAPPHRALVAALVPLVVAVQVAFVKSKTLKPVFSLYRFQGLKPGGFKRDGSTAFDWHRPTS
jgi:hypothetical protein